MRARGSEGTGRGMALKRVVVGIPGESERPAMSMAGAATRS